jgi:hypothetical protein
MHQIANTRVRTEWGWRQRSINKARLSFNASFQRRGSRVATQIHRCLIAHDGIASMAQLRNWAYIGQPRQHWHYKWIYAALRRLGAKRIGWGVYATYARHSK